MLRTGVFFLLILALPVSALERLSVLDSPRLVADFTLDEPGRTRDFSREALLGRWTLALVGFTSCPDVCPLTLNMLNAVRRGLPEMDAEQVQILMVAVDPERDRDRLALYVRNFGPGIRGITGSEERLAPLVESMGARYQLEKPNHHGDYMVTHSGIVSVINPQAEIVAELMPPFPREQTVSFLNQLIQDD